MDFPYEFSSLEPILREKYPEVYEKLIFVGPKRFCYFRKYENYAKIIYNFEVRKDDVWIFGCPRSGTTVAQEMVWLIANDLDYERASKEVMDVRFPVLENAAAFKEDMEKLSNDGGACRKDAAEIARKLSKPAWEQMAETTERRFIKTHLPFSLAPAGVLKNDCKIFYLMRNPKDVCVSNFMLQKSFDMIEEQLPFEAFWDRFRHGITFSMPYFEHVKEGLEQRNNKNVMILYYDEYIKDMRKTLHAVANFLDKQLTDQQIDGLMNHLNIDNFRKNKSVNNDHLRDLGLMKNKDDEFIRKGKIGGWREHFDERTNAEADEWIKENLKDIDFKF